MFTLLSPFLDLIVGFGTPHLGQVLASVETFLLHSLQGFNAIEKQHVFDMSIHFQLLANARMVWEFFDFNVDWHRLS